MAHIVRSIDVYPEDVEELFDEMDPDDQLDVLTKLSSSLEDEDVREEIIHQMDTGTDFSGLRLLVDGMMAKRI